MKKYGVIVSEAAVKQELLNQRIDPKTATNQQKVQARLNIIMAGTTAAQGDAIRSAGSYANQMKTLSGAMMDLSAAIGTAVLPAVTALVTWAVTIARATAAWVEDNQTLVMILGIVAAVVAVVSGGLVALGTLLTLYSVVAAGATGATAAFGVVLAIISAHPIIAALTAIAALVLGVAAYFGLASDAAGDFNSSLDSVDVPGASTSSAAAAQSSRVQADLQAALGGAPARPVAAAAVATKPTPSRDYGAEIAKATRETADGIAHLLRIAKYNPLTAPSSLIASFLP
jgi:hypothetical protein